MIKRFPHYRQLDSVDCGPSCIRIIAQHYGKTYALSGLREKSYYTREGVSMLGICDAAESIGFRTLGVKVTFQQLKEDAPLPFIAHWRQRHFLVVYGFKKGHVLISDPAHGLVKMTDEEFKAGWISSTENGQPVGLAMMMEPTPDFYLASDEKIEKSSIAYFFSYLRPHKKFIVQLILGMIMGSIIQLSMPFIAQSIVDYGIQNQNLNFVILITLAQVVLMISTAAVDFIRSWILLHLGSRINISLLSDFLVKLMKLPQSFFDSKSMGDLLQRMDDHRRIEAFLTSSSLSLVFSFVNLFVFGIVLFIYDWSIFSIFVVGSALYMGWVLLFQKKRRTLDYKRFDTLASDQNKLFQLLSGMQEIKLHNCEKQKRWEWERIQVKLFKLSSRGLAINQYQWSGSVFINESKNLLISFIAAKSVIDGEITLGMMMAVQYIIGQLNAPVHQFIDFIRSSQDAKISLERLGEIHNQLDEQVADSTKITIMPQRGEINLVDLSFQYGGPHSAYSLKNINLSIPQGKITAIVGASGSGKTTLLKLLLKFYEPTDGKINLGDINLNNFNNALWRDHCGAVLQDGFIFSDTIARNVAVGDSQPDTTKLLYAVRVANIQEFVESLPLGYNTKIGHEGVGVSQGQKQRILIARAVYKNPQYLFFDEATNALDANNEKAIMENLNEFYKGRTVVIVAHRLSTVRNADQIIVLEKGEIREVGDHTTLTQLKGYYYELVKNQLELGN